MSNLIDHFQPFATAAVERDRLVRMRDRLLADWQAGVGGPPHTTINRLNLEIGRLAEQARIHRATHHLDALEAPP